MRPADQMIAIILSTIHSCSLAERSQNAKSFQLVKHLLVMRALIGQRFRLRGLGRSSYDPPQPWTGYGTYLARGLVITAAPRRRFGHSENFRPTERPRCRKRTKRHRQIFCAAITDEKKAPRFAALSKLAIRNLSGSSEGCPRACLLWNVHGRHFATATRGHRRRPAVRCRPRRGSFPPAPRSIRAESCRDWQADECSRWEYSLTRFRARCARHCRS
jgi:hypothetical protein